MFINFVAQKINGLNLRLVAGCCIFEILKQIDMTLQDCIDNRRWAESMINEVNEAIKNRWSESLVKQYWYLKDWTEKFDRLISLFTCWNESHVVYQDGLKQLKELSRSL